MLGSEFSRLIAFHDFKVQGTLCPLARVACVACQLSSSKQTDGIARLLVKADLQAVSAKRKDELLQTESGLRDGLPACFFLELP